LANGIVPDAKEFKRDDMEKQRRLSDKIIIAHAQACDDGNWEIAGLLLRALEVQLTAIGGTMVEHRQSMPELNEAFDRQEKLKAAQ
jgi:hypothetical protein